MNDTEFRSGFVGILGAPNVGKSTLLNRILAYKVAITSNKPQTTRHRILGVWTSPTAQAVFMDTPGLHQGGGLLNREMVNQALSVLEDADLILFIVAPDRRGPDEDLALETLQRQDKPVILALNKVDTMNKADLLPWMDELNRRLKLAALVPVSALKGDNLDALLTEIVRQLPQGPRYYPEDTLTDQPERLIAAEMIREQVFRLTGQEIPYATAVTVEAFKEDRPDLVRIQATIHVERDSQKKIVIGERAAKLKEIGTAARQNIERMTGTRVFLELFVRVEKNWSKNPAALKRFGYT